MSLALLYGIACAAYVWLRQPEATGRARRDRLLLVSVLVHTFELGMYAIGTRRAADGRAHRSNLDLRVDARRVLSVDRGVHRRARYRHLRHAAARGPAGLVAHGEMPTDVPRYFATPFVAVHVGALLFAYASFALACVIGITYVLLFRELKRRTPDVLPAVAISCRRWIG